MARRKSARQIYDQTTRIVQQTAERSGHWESVANGGRRWVVDKQINGRLDRVGGINSRYIDNIRRYFGSGSSISNADYDKPVSRSVYMGLSNG